MKTTILLVIISSFINGVFGDEVKLVSVMEGDSLTLHTNITEIQKDDLIHWTFDKTRIAEINRAAHGILIIGDALDGRFVGRLKLNEIGDLTITNIKSSDSGLYELDMTVGGREIKTSFKVIGVVGVGGLKSVSVMEGDSVTLLTDVSYIKIYDDVLWRYQHNIIAELNRNTGVISTSTNERFKDKLQLDNEFGSLTIRNIRKDHSGLYEVDIRSRTHTIHQSFTLNVNGEVKSVSVIEDHDVNLYTDVPDVQTYDLIVWMFGDKDTRIAKVNKIEASSTTFNVLDGKFTNKLRLNGQTGDLTITNIRTEDAGVYQMKMNSSRRLIQRRFDVTVSERGLSSGVVAVIVLLVLGVVAGVVAGVVGVMFYHHRISEVKKKWEPLYVNEGGSVDLKTDITDIQRVHVIEWTFGDKETVIAEVNPANNIFRTYNDDDLFKDNLKINKQTGDLIINDIRMRHREYYTLKIIRDNKTSYKTFNVIVRPNRESLYVNEGESVDLKTDITDIKRDDVIEWRFGYKETLIAEINPANNIFRTYNDDLFKDKLQINHQTGNLIINDIRHEHKGPYKLKIIRGKETSYKTFIVIVRTNIETLKVNEGESVDLKTDITDIKRDDVIEWRFGETLIAEINPANNIYRTSKDDDDLFKYKLQINHQTGDLTINDIRHKHGENYKLKIIRGKETSYKTFFVAVTGNEQLDDKETTLAFNANRNENESVIPLLDIDTNRSNDSPV